MRLIRATSVPYTGCFTTLGHNCRVNHRTQVQWLRLVLPREPIWVGVFSPLHLRTETDPVFETSCFCSQKNTGRWKKSKTPVTMCCTPSSEPYKIYLLSDRFVLGLFKDTFSFLIYIWIWWGKETKRRWWFLLCHDFILGFVWENYEKRQSA
jgi:hypothetical protein